MLPAMKSLIFVTRKREVIVVKKTTAFDILRPWIYDAK